MQNTHDSAVLQICALTYGYHSLKNNFGKRLVQNCRSRLFDNTASLAIDVLKSAVLRLLPMLRSGFEARAYTQHCDMTLTRIAAEDFNVSFPTATDDIGREFCEHECSELPPGRHHPHCSQAFLLAEQGQPAELEREGTSG